MNSSRNGMSSELVFDSAFFRTFAVATSSNPFSAANSRASMLNADFSCPSIFLSLVVMRRRIIATTQFSARFVWGVSLPTSAIRSLRVSGYLAALPSKVSPFTRGRLDGVVVTRFDSTPASFKASLIEFPRGSSSPFALIPVKTCCVGASPPSKASTNPKEVPASSGTARSIGAMFSSNTLVVRGLLPSSSRGSSCAAISGSCD